MDNMDIDSDGINLAVWKSDDHDPARKKYCAALKKKRNTKIVVHSNGTVEIKKKGTSQWKEYVKYKGSIEAAVEGKRSGEWNRFLSSRVGRESKHAMTSKDKPKESIWNKLSILTGIPTIIAISIISATALIIQMDSEWYMKVIYSIFPAIMIYVALKDVGEVRI